MRYLLPLLLVLNAVAQPPPDFEKDVAPILSRRCLGCHAGNVKMGTLDLDTMEGIRTGGNHGVILVPGKSQDSRLYLTLVGKAVPAMPLSGERLPDTEIETIRHWIDHGAPAPSSGFRVSSLDPAQDARPAIQPQHAVEPQIFSLAWSPSGDKIALGGYQEVRLVDGQTNSLLATLPGHAENVRGLAFTSDGKLLAAGGGLPGRKGEVKIWDVASHKLLQTLTGHDDTVYAVAFSPDGQILATSSYDRLIKFWSPATGKEIRTLKDHIDAVYALAFTPDGSLLLSGSADRSVKVWDPATGNRLYTLSEPLDGINAIAIHPSGKIVAAGGLDRTIRLWDINPKSGALKTSLIAHEAPILAIAFSPDGSRLATASADRTIKIFRTDGLEEVQVLRDQPDWVTGLRFAPDGAHLAAGRFDGSLTLYKTAEFDRQARDIRAAKVNTQIGE